MCRASVLFSSISTSVSIFTMVVLALERYIKTTCCYGRNKEDFELRPKAHKIFFERQLLRSKCIRELKLLTNRLFSADHSKL